MGQKNPKLSKGLMTRGTGRRGTSGLQRGPVGSTGNQLQITRPLWDKVERSDLKSIIVRKTLTSSTGCTIKYIVSGPDAKVVGKEKSKPKTKIDATVSFKKAKIKIQSGKYVFPVAAPWKFRDSWGDRRPYRDKRDKHGNLIKAYHGGVDIYSSVGQEIYAVTDGRIIAVRNDPTSRTGKKVFLLGKDGIQYGYIHIDNIQVKKRQQVKKGDIIAYSGRTGIKSSAEHTHFQMKKGGKSVDPFEMLLQITGFNTSVRSKNRLRTYYHHYGDFGVLLIRRREELERQGLIVKE